MHYKRNSHGSKRVLRHSSSANTYYKEGKEGGWKMAGIVFTGFLFVIAILLEQRNEQRKNRAG